MRPLRFAVQVAVAPPGREWRERARQLESLGYGTLVMPDHVVGGGLASFPALAAAAASTSRLRLGNLVLANDFRNPLLLAREALTVDLLSDGRLELGLGAGWHTRDYESLGIPYDGGGVRVDRLAESLALLKRLFTEDEVTHHGAHYRLEQAVALPKAVQRPHPPIMVAGGGKRILALAAREADIAGLAPRTDAKGELSRAELALASVERKIAHVLAAAGQRYPGALELNILVFDTIVTDDRARAVAETAQRLGVDAAVVDGSPHFLFGTLAEIGAQIERTRDRLGITYFSVRGAHVDALAPLARELGERAGR